jgi:branched-chain amino acid aminotransferase
MEMEQENAWTWLDGEWLPKDKALITVGTHSLHYGLGCFEGIRSYSCDAGPAIFRLDAHLERLEGSAKILGLELPFQRERLRDVCIEAVRRNRLGDGYIRPLVFLGDEKLGMDTTGLSVRVAVLAWAWGRYLGPDALERGVRAKISSWSRHHPNVMPCRAKSVAAYTNSILAAREARSEGYDEAILLDTDGFVAEGPGENLFVVRRGEILEPEMTVALDGITRRTIHALAADLGLPLRACRLTRDDLYLADEAFFVGTAAEITPVTEIDRRRVGKGEPGPMTRSLQERYFALVRGKDEARADWLTPVGSA